MARARVGMGAAVLDGACARACVRACMHVCACVRARVLACVHVHVCACARVPAAALLGTAPPRRRSADRPVRQVLTVCPTDWSLYGPWSRRRNVQSPIRYALRMRRLDSEHLELTRKRWLVKFELRASEVIERAVTLPDVLQLVLLDEAARPTGAGGLGGGSRSRVLWRHAWESDAALIPSVMTVAYDMQVRVGRTYAVSLRSLYPIMT